MRKLIVIEKATKVTLRGRLNTSGLITLYLDWGSGENRGFDFLKDQIHNSPKTAQEKKHNEDILKKAKAKLSLKNAEIFQDNPAMIKTLSNVYDFLPFRQEAPKERGEAQKAKHD
jgi:hypothetical protein